jgi:hypothetical protein
MNPFLNFKRTEINLQGILEIVHTLLMLIFLFVAQADSLLKM